MIKDFQVKLESVSKRYNIYDRPTDRLKEIVWRNRRCYHKEFWAIKSFTYAFPRHTTALLGPNGSGKSTLLQLIAGVLQPTSGKITLNGRVTAILELGAGFRPEYTGRENVLLNGMILGIPKEEMLKRMDAIAEFAEIGDFFDQPIKTYSSGMTVRLAFSCATNVDPEILLVDEALAVGDINFIRKCRQRIFELQSAAKTIILVSHDMETVREFCQSAVLLHDGNIVADGSTDEVVPLYESAMDKDLLKSSKVLSKAVSIF